MPPSVDICIVCALPEELQAVQRVFHRRSRIRFQADKGQQSRNYFRGTLVTRTKQQFTVHLSCPPRYQGIEVALHLKPILQEFEPRIAAMAGICAGDRRDTHLGDLIVAENAFQYDTGKFSIDDRGTRVHEKDTRTYHPGQDLLAFARTFTSWKKSIRQMHKPKSLRMQTEWLIARLAAESGISVDHLPTEELEANAPQWRRVLRRMQSESPALIDTGLRLASREMIRNLHLRPEPFPFVDPEVECLIKPMASGNAVRSDKPFDEIRLPVRTAVAVDMEGAAFYRTLADFSSISGLVVKSVCDFADPEKDDTYHKFAAEASARYLYAFLDEYLTIPSQGPQQRTSAHRFAPDGRDDDQSTRVLRRLSRNTAEDAVVVLHSEQTALRQTVRLDTGLYIRRNIEEDILRVDFGDKRQSLCALVVGSAGCGKTSLLWHVFEVLSSKQELSTWFLRASFLRAPATPDVQTRILDPATLVLAARNVTEAQRQPVLLLDTVDLLLHSESSRDLLLDMLTQLREIRCHTIMSCRHQEARLLGPVVTHSFALDDYQEQPRNELHAAIQSHCHVFYRAHPVAEADAGIQHLNQSVARGLPLKTLLANPLLMRMVFSIYAPDRVPEEIHVFRLYEEYWDRRVRSDVRAGSPVATVGARDLSDVAAVTAIVMLTYGTPEIEEELWTNSSEALGISPEHRHTVLARGVIRRSETGLVAFFHQTFFEHSAARALLTRFGSEALSLIRDRVDARSADLFVAPVYEQALLIGEVWPGLKQDADRMLAEDILHPLVTRRSSALYVYCHRRDIPAHVSLLLKSRIPVEESGVLSLLLRAAANVSSRRIPEIYELLSIIWGRDHRSEREQVLQLLERFVHRARTETMRFVEFHALSTYVLSLPPLMTLDRMLVRVFGAIASDQPQWAWEKLLEMYIAAAERAVSQDVLIAILQTIAANAEHFGERNLATRVEQRLPSWHGSQVSGFQVLSDGLGDLWCIEWRASGATLERVLGALEGTVDILRLQARYSGLVKWAMNTPFCDIGKLFGIALERRNREWRWTRIVIPRLLANHAALVGRADLLGLTRRALMDALRDDNTSAGLATWRAAVVAAQLDRDAFNGLFSDERFQSPDLWLDADALGELLGAGYLAGHSGAIRAFSKFETMPGRFDERLRNGVRARLAESAQSNIHVARKALEVSILLKDGTGLTNLILQISNAWPSVLSEQANALISLRDVLLASRSGATNRSGVTLWKELVRLGVLEPPPSQCLFALFDRLTDKPAKAHVLELVGQAALLSTEPLLPTIDRLGELRKHSSASIAEAAYLAIATAAGRPGPDVGTIWARVLDLVLTSPTNAARVSALGPVLERVSELRPNDCFRFCERLLTCDAVSQLGAQSKRTLAHRLRLPVRHAIRGMLPSERIQIAMLIKTMDAHLARLVVEVLCKEDFDAVLSSLDSLLSDDNVDSRTKEMIRRQKYVRQRSQGGDAWLELMRLWREVGNARAF